MPPPDPARFTSSLLHHAADPFRLLVESVQDYAIYLLDPGGRIVSWNTGAERMKGYTTEEVLGQPFDLMFTPDDRAAGKPGLVLAAALADGKYEQEGSRPRKDGTTFWAIYTVTALHDHGRHIGFAVVLKDITGRKRAEDAVRRERDLADAILNSLPGIYYLYDETRTFRRWNKRFETVTGCTAEEVAAAHPLDFFAGDEKELLADRIAEVFRSGHSEAEAHFVAKNGTRTPYYFNGVRAVIDGRPYLLGMGIDITARKRAEALLHETDTRLRLAAQAGNVGLWEWDLVTNHHYCSPEWKSQLGYEDHEIGDDPREWSDRLHPDDAGQAQWAVSEVIANKEPTYRNEFRLRHKDGSYRWILAQATVTFDDRGRPAKMLGSHVDITDRREAEERFRLFMDNSPAAAWITDTDGRLTYVSESYRRKFLLPDGDVVGKSVADLYPPDVARVYVDNIKDVGESGRILEAIEPGVRSDGTPGEFWVFKFPLRSGGANARRRGGDRRDRAEAGRGDPPGDGGAVPAVHGPHPRPDLGHRRGRGQPVRQRGPGAGTPPAARGDHRAAGGRTPRRHRPQ